MQGPFSTEWNLIILTFTVKFKQISEQSVVEPLPNPKTLANFFLTCHGWVSNSGSGERQLAGSGSA